MLQCDVQVRFRYDLLKEMFASLLRPAKLQYLGIMAEKRNDNAADDSTRSAAQCSFFLTIPERKKETARVI